MSHRTASVEEIEAASPADPTAAMERLMAREAVSECFVLQTCNRAEWYVVTTTAETGREVLKEALPTAPPDGAVWLPHEDALEHLLRVGAGLESMVIGEDQIVGQLRRASEEANRIGALGYLLEDAVWKAIHCGERARAETGINEGVVSLARAGVNLADRRVDLSGATALVVGAGEMGKRASQAFADAPVARLLIANRTIPHAEHIARSVPADAVALGLEDLPEALRKVDVVVTATGSPRHLIDCDELAGAGETVAIDIAQPRDVDPAATDLADVALYDLDDLETLTSQTRRERAAEARTVAELVERELDHLQTRFKRKQADEVIAAMYEGADRIKEREVRNARNKLSARGELSEAQAEVIDALADALMGQLLAAPTKSLRDAAAEDDWETIQTALQLFDPEFPTGQVDRSDAAPARPHGEEAGEDA